MVGKYFHLLSDNPDKQTILLYQGFEHWQEWERI